MERWNAGTVGLSLIEGSDARAEDDLGRGRHKKIFILFKFGIFGRLRDCNIQHLVG